jgi:hypothetical protein
MMHTSGLVSIIRVRLEDLTTKRNKKKKDKGKGKAKKEKERCFMPCCRHITSSVSNCRSF